MNSSESVNYSPRVGAILQVRMGSTRLPGKALLPLPLSGAVPLLGQVLARARRAETLARLVVATSTAPADDPVAAYAATAGAAVFRGDEQDVLGRFAGAADAHGLDVIVRLTGDNPALDPAYLDQAVRHHLATGADYTLTTGLPLGGNVEVIGRAALARAHAQATAPPDREHVTPYLRHHPNQFRLETLALMVPGLPAATRLTLDYPSDYALMHLLYSSLPADFTLSQVAGLLQAHPWLAAINSANEQVKVS